MSARSIRTVMHVVCCPDFLKSIQPQPGYAKKENFITSPRLLMKRMFLFSTWSTLSYRVAWVILNLEMFVENVPNFPDWLRIGAQVCTLLLLVLISNNNIFFSSKWAKIMKRKLPAHIQMTRLREEDLLSVVISSRMKAAEEGKPWRTWMAIH